MKERKKDADFVIQMKDLEWVLDVEMEFNGVNRNTHHHSGIKISTIICNHLQITSTKISEN